VTLSQFNIRVNPVGKHEHLRFHDISKVPLSNWYKYTLMCGHEVYSRVRIRAPKDYGYMEHYIQCSVRKHEPLNWQAVVKMEGVSDADVRNVPSATSFIVPRRILRCDGHDDRTKRIVPSGNPFPYVNRDRDY
jgi:hypothetical protein